jgi:hypothetical protein
VLVLIGYYTSVALGMKVHPGADPAVMDRMSNPR